MKILLLLVLKYLIYSKITGDHIYQSEIRDVYSQKLHLGQNDIDECFEQKSARVKRDSSILEPSIFEPVDLERSPRRKRAVLRKQNQIFFRRRKKKLFRKSKIRKSLMRRGKFTTTTPFRNMKRYTAGKGKIARPPGLKYRKKYRFNKFKKTHDVALGLGADGMAQFKKSAPKKRAPIHVRDYERGRGTRKAFRGRVGERRSPVDADRRRAGAKDRRKSAAGDRDFAKKPKKDYYDESDYNSRLGEDSLPRQTKARKYNTFGKTTKRKKVSKSLKIEDSEYADSDEDNTLLLSDDEQLTDVSSEIEALRSELSDERPRHRKNASSSEYEQYSYAEDDSAIVKGEVISSKEESPERVTFARKTTLLGPVNYDQYDLKKLDASMERVFKRKKSKKEKAIAAVLQDDDPLEYLEDAYKDETSYETSSDTKQTKQKGKKSKSKVKKGQEKSKTRSKKGQELRTKASKAQTKAKPETDTEESYSHDDPEEYAESSSEKEQSKAKLEKEAEKSYSYDDPEEYVESSSEKEQSKTKLEKGSKESGSNEETEEYYSDEYDEYSTYEETVTPKRRIPTSKIIQHSKQSKFYEEYTDTDDDNTNSKPGSKSKKGLNAATGKITCKTKPPSKKGHEKSTYESEEYDSEEYSEAESSHEHKNKQKKTAVTSKKDSKTVAAKIKSDSKKGHETSTYESEEYDSEEYSDSDISNKHHSDKITRKKDPIKSKKSTSKKTPSKKDSETSTNESDEYDSEYSNESDKNTPKKITRGGKMAAKDLKKDLDTSEFISQYNSYDSEECSDSGTSNKHHSDKIARKKDPIKSKKSTSKKIPSKKDSETSTNESDEYDSEYSNESDKETPKFITTEPTFIVPTTKKITRGGKMATKKKSKSEKKQGTSIYESGEYDSYYSDSHSDKHKDEKLGLDDIKSKKDLKFSPSQEMEMKNHQLDVIKSSKDQKLPLSRKNNLSSSNVETSMDESDDNYSNYSHDDTDESHKLKSSGKGDFKAPSSEKAALEKEPAKDIKTKKTLPQKTTLKISSIKTTKNKQKAKKTLETSYEESNYDSQVTSYEYSSDDVTQSKKSLSQQITSFDKYPTYYIPSESILMQKTTHQKDHETSYDGLQDIRTQTNHTEDHPKDKLLRSHYDKNESTKASRRKTTSTTKRQKKGFTTLPSTPTKGFDSAEALLKVSSKAAAIIKKHMFLYNSRKKAYELVRIHSSQPQEDVRHSAATQNLDHTISKHAVGNSTEIRRRTTKSSRKRSTAPESVSDTFSK